MARAVISLLTVGVMIYALVDCWRSLPTEVQRLTRAGWTVVIVAIPLLGAVAYLVLGRVPATAGPGHVAMRRVVAPDDDPEFLRSLDLQRRQDAAEERRRASAEEKRRKSEAKAEQKAERAEQKAERAEQKADRKADRAAERAADRTTDRDDRRAPSPGAGPAGSPPADPTPDDAEPHPTDDGDA